jgi:hypothetical protein
VAAAAKGALHVGLPRRCLGDVDVAIVARALWSGACHGMRPPNVSHNWIGPVGVSALTESIASGWADNPRSPGVHGVPWDPFAPLEDPRDPLKTQYNPLKTLLGPPDFGPRELWLSESYRPSALTKARDRSYV